jgi:hypothetical protein
VETIWVVVLNIFVVCFLKERALNGYAVEARECYPFIQARVVLQVNKAEFLSPGQVSSYLHHVLDVAPFTKKGENAT